MPTRPGNDNGFAVYLGVQCTDVAWPTNWSHLEPRQLADLRLGAVRDVGQRVVQRSVHLLAGAASRPVHINGRGVTSTLLIDETLDAATPFPGSLEVRKLFPNSVLLAEPGGTSHADSLFGDFCVDGTIAAYLTTGALPRRNNHAPWDKTCAAAAGPGARRAQPPRPPRTRRRLERPVCGLASCHSGQSAQPLARLGLPAVELR